jgi:hypothetical protein
MFDKYSKRDLAVIFGTIIIVCALSAWGSIYVIKNFVIGERNDPLDRAGGLKPKAIVK